MTLKVVGAGFGRTGTTSLQAALEELGFSRCYHMQEVMKNPSHAYLWEKVANGELVHFSVIFQGYQATVDWPGCTYYKELMELYPDSKVLLSVRDPERWYTSTQDTIYRIPQALVTQLLKLLFPHLRVAYRMIDRLIWQGTFEGRFEDQENAITIFNRHNAEVEQYVSSGRLLVYNVKEGWEPLCRFLDVPVPQDKSFPHLNDTLLLQRVMRWGPVVIIASIICLLVLLVWLLSLLS